MSKTKHISCLLLAIMLLSLLFLTGCSKVDKDLVSEEPPISAEDEEIIENKDEDDESQEDTEIGWNKAEDFTLDNIIDESISLKDFKGKPVVLTFWVTWNEASVQQLETLQNVYPLIKDDVVFLAVNATSFETEGEEQVKDFTRDKNYSYHVLMDEDGSVNKAYYIGSFPTMFFIDDEGIITKMYTAHIKEDRILEELEILLSGQ